MTNKRLSKIGAGLFLLMLLSGAYPVLANSILLPVRKPVQLSAAQDIQQPILLPVRKPGTSVVASYKEPVQTSRASAKTITKQSIVGRLFDRLTASRRLSEEDAARYANIFGFQDNADFDKADHEIAKLKDHRLMGHVLFQRYLSKQYAASYAELADWMKTYADYPDADKIYALALKRKTAGNDRLKAPIDTKGVPAFQDFDVGQLAQPYLDTAKLAPRARDVMKRIDDLLAKDSATAAAKHLESSKTLFTNTAYDAVQAQIAQSYFYNGKFDKALLYAEKSVHRSGDELPLAGWIAGLSAWKKGLYREAAGYFAQSAGSGRASAWMTSASAHWAARSYLRAHQPQKVSYWLKKSAEYPRTFYGIISMKALGMDPTRFRWDVPTLTEKHEKALAAVPAGKRALGLVDAGYPLLAEAELKQINPGSNVVLKEALIAIAHEGGMPALSLRMGSGFRDADNRLYDAALYPDVPWTPSKGFEVDKALVYAYIRQESKFEASANNRSSGAQGLMQLMPATARHIAKLSGEALEDGQLSDPQTNIDLGQKYLSHLLKEQSVGNNLFKLAVAYNAGPGKLSRWEKQVDYDNDPLLFIESIPVTETRIFVERVMTNFWIYRLKYDQKTDSLDRVASGEWPVYVAQDIRRGPRFAQAAIAFFTR